MATDKQIPAISDDDLMNYLDGKLSAAQSHELEAIMADSPFVNDAVEGLQQFSQKGNLQDLVTQLNKDLQQKVADKKQRKAKRAIKNVNGVVLAVIFVIFLCVMGYMVIKMSTKSDQKNLPTPPPKTEVKSAT
jgi:anti-sigma factor RsiW